MKNFAITFVAVTCMTSMMSAKLTAGCASCGSHQQACCVPDTSCVAIETTHWSVCSDEICVFRCRLLSGLQFWKKTTCDSCDSQGCDGGCRGPGKHGCTIRPRNRLMRKTLVEYVPALDYVVVPVCQTCQSPDVYGEPVEVPPPYPYPELAAVARRQPASQGKPLTGVNIQSPVSRGVRLTSGDNSASARVHWVGPRPVAEPKNASRARRFRLSDFASPFGASASTPQLPEGQASDQDRR